MNIWDDEGVRYKEPKWKVVGMESVKSSTPAICRDRLKGIYKIALNGTNDECIEYINEFRVEFNDKKIEDIAFPRGVNEIDKWVHPMGGTISRTPIHVKGSYHYNRILVENDLTDSYPLIQEGDKIKFIYLKEQNPVGNNTIAFHSYLPKEMNLEKYVDKNVMFDKMFIKPTLSILESVGWTVKKVITFDVF